MRRAMGLVFVLVIGAWSVVPSARQAKSAPPKDPILVLETVKGTIEIQLFRSETPKSVDHVVELAKRSFYRGQRFHRALTPQHRRADDRADRQRPDPLDERPGLLAAPVVEVDALGPTREGVGHVRRRTGVAQQ